MRTAILSHAVREKNRMLSWKLFGSATTEKRFRKRLELMISSCPSEHEIQVLQPWVRQPWQSIPETGLFGIECTPLGPMIGTVDPPSAYQSLQTAAKPGRNQL